jgi:hypothetical protein
LAVLNPIIITSSKIHIVSFDIPSPPNYGGVIDIFYKVKSLYELGYQITLHCYEYNERTISEELNKYCYRIYTYARNFLFVNPFKFYIPMIVFTRNHRMLLMQLTVDNAPILFEGLHSTYFLKHSKLKNRFKIVRTHNIEHDYYKCLAINETHFFKKIYFQIEAFLLKKYEKVLHNANLILAISPSDNIYLASKYKNVFLVNAFHGFEFNINAFSKYYALYHGKLNVNENQRAAEYLIEEVFVHTDFPLLIAGNKPTEKLRNIAKKYKHIRVIRSPNMNRMDELINEAHIHVLPTFQATGIKLKLLHVLFRGKYIIANKQMVENTGLEAFVIIANTPLEILRKVEELKDKPFDLKEIEKRKRVLLENYNNFDNAKKIDSIIKQLTQIK